MAKCGYCAVREGLLPRHPPCLRLAVQPWLQTSEEAQSRAVKSFGMVSRMWLVVPGTVARYEASNEVLRRELGLEGCRSLGRMGRPRFLKLCSLEPRFPTGGALHHSWLPKRQAKQ